MAVLPEGVVNQIAAGEVVERPASVVKELVENALDAKASRLEITLESAGRERIAVADDGVGMSREDALLAFERHATSKIDGVDDLERVETLGFRGEALPSIAAVSRLVLETAPAGGGEGTRIRIDGGARTAVEPIARAPGTTVDVRHLFFNTPGRRKFLKSRSTERAHAVRRLLEMAMARPDVAWRVDHGPRRLLDVAPADSLRERLAALFDLPYVETLLPVRGGEDGIALRGFVQRAAAAGASRRRQYVFVDGRPVDAPTVVGAAVRGYRSTLPKGARPDLFLFLGLGPGGVDVNVHPTKREVRFRDPAAVANVVESAVRESLGAGPEAARSYRVSAPRDSASRSGRGAGQLGMFYGRRGVRESAGGEPYAGGGTESGEIVEAAETEAAEAAEAEAVPALWQLHDRFILAQTGSGLAIIDQHSAHERVLYEEVIEDLREGSRPGQRLLFPEVLHLTPEQHATWESYRGLIERLGFEVEPFGGHAVAVSAIPAFRHAFDAEEALAGLLDDLGEPGAGSADMNQHERVARLFACKAAIKAGTRLAEEEMNELIDRLFATRLPYDDVHGRPAILKVGLDELDRHFGRH